MRETEYFWTVEVKNMISSKVDAEKLFEYSNSCGAIDYVGYRPTRSYRDGKGFYPIYVLMFRTEEDAKSFARKTKDVKKLCGADISRKVKHTSFWKDMWK